MIHDIFEKKKRSGKTDHNIRPVPKIIADIHEKDSMIFAHLHSERSVSLIIKPLKIGDFIISDFVIERKTVPDLYSSLISKRLQRQLKNLLTLPSPIILIEGENSGIIEDNIYKGLVLSMITRHKIPIIFAKDSADSARYLIALAKRQGKRHYAESLHSKIPDSIDRQKRYILESFPRIGPKTAILLLENFRSLDEIFSAGPDQLRPFLKSHTDDFIRILNHLNNLNHNI